MFHHDSVLADEVVAALAPAIIPGATVVDATVGGGGHAAQLLTLGVVFRLVGLDRDPVALRAAALRLSGETRCEWVHAPFSHLDAILDEREIRAVHAIVADLGVSSHQIDEPSRGFSFRHESALDMRMDQSSGISAAEFLADVDALALAQVLREYGEERAALRIAAAIVRARPTTTRALVDAITSVLGGPRPGTIHPATRTFQAIRIFVNREILELETFLEHAPQRLAVGGRLAIISFHSLEDRRVKQRFSSLSKPPELPRRLPVRAADLPIPRFAVPAGYSGGIVPGPNEVERNPRARSARMRVLERISA